MSWLWHTSFYCLSGIGKMTHYPNSLSSLQNFISKTHIKVTYPPWACCRQFVERLCQMDSRIVHHLTYRIVFFFSSKGQLRECSLISWSIFYVYEVFFIGDSVILRQFKEANEGLQQRSPICKEGGLKLECLKYVRTGCNSLEPFKFSPCRYLLSY